MVLVFWFEAADHVCDCGLCFGVVACVYGFEVEHFVVGVENADGVSVAVFDFFELEIFE